MSVSETCDNFVVVDKESSHYSKVRDVFREREEVYGDQKASLEKIEKGSDRNCEVLIGKDSKPSCLLVYKLKPIRQYEGYPIYDSLEVKTFMLLDHYKEENDVKPFEEMLRRVIGLAKKVEASSIHMTVSAKEPWTREFLIKHDFKLYRTWEGKYLEGVKESLMGLSLKGRPDRPPGASNRESMKRKREDDHSSRDNGQWREKRARNDQAGPPRAGEARVKHVTLKQCYIRQIQDGRKTVEGRLAGGMFDRWYEGDTVRFFCSYGRNTDQVFCKIKKKTRYASFREMLKAEGVSACIPDCKDLDRAVKMYLDIPRYKEKEKSGVFAFQLTLVDK